ncbi:myeloid-associated differentiation marker homolog [Cetorhinus maximus]
MAVGNLQALNSRVGYCRLAAALFACVAFALVLHSGYWSSREGGWCVFAWCFSFVATLLVLGVELAGLQGRVPVSWRNGPITLAALAACLCLSASVVYPLFHLGRDGPRGEAYSYGVAATVFSCLAAVAYGAEVSLTRARPGEVTGYMATVPGLLKVVEALVACVLFVFVSGASYRDHGGLQWCLAVYCICFILSAVVVLLCVGECTSWLPIPFDRWVGGYALLAALLYATALVVWPIFCFDSRYGQASRPAGCSHAGYRCQWDNRLAVAVLTGVNFLVYLADLVHSGRLIFIKV